MVLRFIRESHFPTQHAHRPESPDPRRQRRRGPRGRRGRWVAYASSSVGPGGGRLRAPAKQSIEEFALSGKGYVAHRMGFTLCNSPLGGILFTVTPGRIWSFSIKSDPSSRRRQPAKCTCRLMDGSKQVTITSSQIYRVKITHLLLLFAPTSAVFFSQQQTAGARNAFTPCFA